jgi:hypothetical protein
MPETPDPTDETEDEGSVGNSTIQRMRQQIKDLQKQAKDAETAARERDEAKAELATIKRDAMFDRLGIPNEGLTKLFRQHYAGELTEEAIKAEAINYGLFQQAPTIPQPTIPGIDQDAYQRQVAAQAGTPIGAQPSAVEALNQLRTTAVTHDGGLEQAINILRANGVLDPTQS